MQFILTDLQKEIKENAEKLLSEQIDLLETIKKVDEDNRLDVELWKLVNEQGWLALDVPEEDGGLGFSSVDSSILSEVSPNITYFFDPFRTTPSFEEVIVV